MGLEARGQGTEQQLVSLNTHAAGIFREAMNDKAGKGEERKRKLIPMMRNIQDTQCQLVVARERN